MKDGLSFMLLLAAVKSGIKFDTSEAVKAIIVVVATAGLTTIMNQKASDARFEEFRQTVTSQINEVKDDIKQIRRDIYTTTRNQ